VESPELQNNGASGGYLRFNYGESSLIHLYNGGANSEHIHIHGHTLRIVNENGNAVTSFLETSYTVAPGQSADVIVQADNPNRIGYWKIANDIQGGSFGPASTVWPGVAITSNGIGAFVDYTGKSQGRLVLNADGVAVPFSWLPPTCFVNEEFVGLSTDRLGWSFRDGGDLFATIG